MNEAEVRPYEWAKRTDNAKQEPLEVPQRQKVKVKLADEIGKLFSGFQKYLYVEMV